nr:hypothetical protein [Tanacetum cinerariifolium]
MRTCSSSSNLVPPFIDPESVIRHSQRNLGDPSRLLDFEEVNINPNNIQGPPPAGPPPQNHNGPPGPNLHMPALDLHTIEELCQPRMNGQGRPIAAWGFMKRRPEECYDLIKNMTAHHNDWDTSAHRGESSSSTTSSSSEIAALAHQMTAYPSTDEILRNFKISTEAKFNSLATSVSRMEKSLQERPQGALPSNTKPNPKADIKAITTRSGIVLDGPLVLPPPPSSKEPSPSSSGIPPSPVSTSFELPNLTEALALMPKYHKMLKDLLYDKKKLLGLANTSLIENCSAVILKKLPEKLRDPRKFLIPCDFFELKKCMALADLGKFTFPADFVVIDHDIDHRVPLILGRPFLRMARALVDHGNESINMSNFIDITCEECFPEVLKIKKSNHPLSESTTLFSDSFPSLTPFKTSDSLLEEFADELAPLDPFPPGNEDDNFDPEADLRKIKYLLNQDPLTESDIEIIDPILERFIDEPAFDYSPLSGDDGDDLSDLKSVNDEWKKLLYGDSYKDIDSEKDKNKDFKMKLLIDEANIVKPNVLPPQLLTSILILGGTQIFNDELKDNDLKDNDLILKERPMKNFPFFCFCPKDKGIQESQARDSHKNKRLSG